MNGPTPRGQRQLILIAGAILLLTMGARQSMGLFVLPISTGGAVGIAAISFALAVGQFVWGASQPLFGIAADRYGPTRILIAGGLLLALGSALTPFLASANGLLFTLGIVSAAGAGAGSFSILIGITAGRLAPERRSFAAGAINACGSAGQLVFAPLMQAIIGAAGWAAAMFTLAATALLTVPLALWLGRGAGAPLHASAGLVPAGPTLRDQLHTAVRDRSYWCLHVGFFTCGFHIAFLATHLPGEVALCGLPASVSATALALIGLFNIAGSLGVGVLGNRYRMKYLLFWLYASRALFIAVFLVSPRTTWTFYLFAAVLGASWLATVPPTAGLVGKLFGTRYLATLFGLTLFSHQIGGFFGAWLGGVTISRYGDYGWMWRADIVLALVAAVANLPIRESRLFPAVRPA